MMDTREALRLGAERLDAAGIDNPRLEARLLLGHALGTEPPSLVASNGVVDSEPYLSLVGRRAAREPLAFIIGTREFWSLPFAVSPATLIPRPDSETLIEAALARFPDRDVRRLLDLGTGTGCLLLAALSEFPHALGIGVDRVPEAARLARDNARRLGLDGRAGFMVGDWAAAIGGRFDLVLCNPPYIRSGELSQLMPDVAAYEPGSALDGGEDGLDAYRRVLADLARLLAPAGAALLEMGEAQAAPLMALAGRYRLTTSCVADLSRIPRVLICTVMP